ncbi:LuxR family maltose regulon positive regulatory protein [Actinoplanes lutulentus]|uniref:LuxR family maltose regulon positive regulatory protein n=1 Tax=Actinoplanes lutulentus TaxID=1287878 RepID=A0A327ZDE6_9ACTN|nr:LuxR C-terminal-related transcriptional regulator [Actinoplanes lutulentus]MBB2941264.1 LuxR family maltose regulon positive regulatory protein [Actinoplanes lutulentus]RAK36756.1 LuxR family maltose regulon positive regulatory protein [Actinoplanes lutulentus]
MSTSDQPAIAEPHLIRPRLHGLLDDGVQRAVTLIRAGPGWGKTTLAAAWAARRPQPVAWLTLRRWHSTVPGFCSGVAAALQAAFPPASVPGRFGHVSDENGLRRLCGGFGQPVPLVLDDMQAIDGSPAMRVLAALIRRQPAGLRFVLLSRTEPDLPLHVPRSAGGLFPLSAADLRFDDRESAALVTLLRPGAVTAATGVVTGPAEGWPVGLRLAALTHGSDPGEEIGDYLTREVIGGQSAAVRRFLMRTSIVDEVPPELADVLAGGTGSRRVLTLLEGRTGLVTGSRYHGQLRAELRRMLDREAPDEVAGLHRRAARWYAGARMIPEAMRHAADGGDWDYLSRLVVVLGPQLSLSPQRDTFAMMLRRIPPELLPTTAEFVVCAVMLAVFAGDIRAVPALIDRARSLLAGRPPVERQAVGIVVDLIEVCTVLRVTGDMPAMVAAAGRILDQLRAEPRTLPIAPHVRAVAKINKGVALLWTLQLEDARQHLSAGLAEARDLGMPITAITAESHLALIAYFRGSLREAERRACEAYAQAEALDVTGSIQVTAAYLALALVEVERDRHVEAQVLLRNAQRSVADPPEATLAVVSVLVRAHLALALGDVAAVAAALRQAREDAGPSLRAPLLSRWLNAVQCEIDLANGEPARVVERLGEVAGPSPAEQVLLGRAHLALGHGTDDLHQVLTGNDPFAAVTAGIAIALAAEARNDSARGEAVRGTAAAARAVALADQEGIIRPFRVLGAGHLRKPEPDSILAEPLTEREIEVLQFLPSVLTASEIAVELAVSVNTIKAHLRSIYRKLGAARRREAVTRANNLNLL